MSTTDTALTVAELRATEGWHEYVLSRPMTTSEVAIGFDVLPRHQESLRGVVSQMFWDFSGFETSRHIYVEGLTTGARPRVEKALYDMLSEINPGAEQEIRASLDALPLDLPT